MTFLVEGFSRSVPAMEFAQEEPHDDGHRLLAGHSHPLAVVELTVQGFFPDQG